MAGGGGGADWGAGGEDGAGAAGARAGAAGAAAAVGGFHEGADDLLPVTAKVTVGTLPDPKGTDHSPVPAAALALSSSSLCLLASACLSDQVNFCPLGRGAAGVGAALPPPENAAILSFKLGPVDVVSSADSC